MLHLICNCKHCATSQCLDKRLAYRYRDSSECTVNYHLHVCLQLSTRTNACCQIEQHPPNFSHKSPMQSTVSTRPVGLSLSHSCSETSTKKPKSSPIFRLLPIHRDSQHYPQHLNQRGFDPVRKQNVPTFDFPTIDWRMMPYPARRRGEQLRNGWNPAPQKW